MKQSEPSTLLIVEDDPHIALYLESLIRQSGGFVLFGSCRSGEEALVLLESLPDTPSMAVVDLGLPGMDGTGLITELLKRDRSMKIVVFTVFEDIPWILESIERGAMGYILKDTPPDRFLAELEVIRRGGATLTPSVAMEIIRRLNAAGVREGTGGEFTFPGHPAGQEVRLDRMTRHQVPIDVSRESRWERRENLGQI